jgi:hypothetical protein
MTEAATKTKPARKRKAKPADKPETVTAYKAFNADWTCNGFAYEVGQTYRHEGRVERCASGFHACEYPLDCLSYYPPTGKFALVELAGDMDREDGGDTKICAAAITIKAELSLPDFIQRGVDYILSRVDWDGAKESNTGDWSAATNTGHWSAATNTGNRSAATNTGYRSAATNTGDWSAATNTGYQSAATNTGNRSAATNTGYRSAATVEGKDSVAMASGYQGRVSGAMGCALFLVERNDDFEIIAAWAGIVGRDGIEPGTFYTLRDGKPVRAGDEK